MQSLIDASRRLSDGCSKIPISKALEHNTFDLSNFALFLDVMGGKLD